LRGDHTAGTLLVFDDDRLAEPPRSALGDRPGDDIGALRAQRNEQADGRDGNAWQLVPAPTRNSRSAARRSAPAWRIRRSCWHLACHRDTVEDALGVAVVVTA
jgi:hypothetical protein